jgi:4-hydroxy-tetrahydrodipicolinate reductase
MAIRVVMAGATGWVGRALIPVIAAQSDMVLAGAVARNAAGQDSGAAVGIQPNGITISATLEEALAAPSDVVVDYTKPDVVKTNAVAAIKKGRHMVIGTSGLGAADFAEIDQAAQANGVGVLAAGNFSITATLMKRFALMAAKYVPDEALADVRGASTAKPVAEVLGLPGTRGAAVGAGAGVQVHSLRLPSYILSCEALFGLPDERLTIRHDAGSSAAPYVAGTLLAIRRVASFKGLVRGLDALMD